jgi:hypothetical protein
MRYGDSADGCGYAFCFDASKVVRELWYTYKEKALDISKQWTRSAR